MNARRNPEVSEPHWDSDFDTGRLTACYRVDKGWAVFIGLQSIGGVVETVEEALLFVGDDDDLLADVAERRAEAVMAVPEVPPAQRMTEVRRRSIKVGHFAADARRRISDKPEFAGFLGPPAWVKDVATGWAKDVATRPGKLTDRDYAIRARDFLRLGGVYRPLAADYFVEPSTAKAWMEEARRRGLLTKPGRGMRGRSTLTDYALEILGQEA